MYDLGHTFQQAAFVDSVIWVFAPVAENLDNVNINKSQQQGRCSMLSLLRVFFRGLRDSLHESDSVARVNSEEGPLFPISTLLHERFRFQNQTEGGKSVSQGAAPVLDE